MSDLLFLARDFIERMANPVYGISTNEDYAIRFATLLRSERFDARLSEEISSLTDRTTLTSHGWLWVFRWARSRHIALEEDLLVALYEQWSSVFARTAIVDLATLNIDYREGQGDGATLKEFPNSFLSKIMLQSTRVPEAKGTRDSERRLLEEQPAPEPVPSTAMAESTLVALLQADKPIALDAAKVLLAHKWEGQRKLLGIFWAICNALDQETREVWIKRLDPPSSPTEDG